MYFRCNRYLYIYKKMLYRALHRVKEGIEWRKAMYLPRLLRPVDYLIFGSVGSRSGLLARTLAYPLPWVKPYRQSEIHLCRPGALGDVLMCTPTFREIRKRNPRARIHFYTNPNFFPLLRGLSCIDELHEFDGVSKGRISMKYEESIPPRRHIAQIMGDRAGVNVTNVVPECALNSEALAMRHAEWQGIPRPIIVINRKAGPWTPNKDWPDDYWNQLIAMLSTSATVVEIGDHGNTRVDPTGSAHLDYRGRTTLEELVTILAVADVHVGPVSGPVHIAAAVGTPSVVIYGGYESPECSAYPGNVNLTMPLDCSPCWLREPCPIERKCLTLIGVESVLAGVRQLVSRSRDSHNERAGPALQRTLE